MGVFGISVNITSSDMLQFVNNDTVVEISVCTANDNEEISACTSNQQECISSIRGSLSHTIIIVLYIIFL